MESVHRTICLANDQKALLEAIPCRWTPPCELDLKDVVTMPISPHHIKQYPWGEPSVRRNSGNLSHPKHVTRINFRFLTILPPRRGLKHQYLECF